MADLVNRSREGRDAVYAALSELEDCGYIVRTTRATSGTFTETTVTVNSTPSPYTGKPDTVDAETPCTGKPCTGNPPLTRLNSNNTDLNKTEERAAAPAPEQTHLFNDPDSLEYMLANLARMWNEAADKSVCKPGLARLFVAKGEQVPVLSADLVRAASAQWAKSVVYQRHWRDALEALPTLADYCGRNQYSKRKGGQWRCDIDHFLRDGNVERIMRRSKGAGWCNDSISRDADQHGFVL
jgi:hypothetical protein